MGGGTKCPRQRCKRIGTNGPRQYDRQRRVLHTGFNADCPRGLLLVSQAKPRDGIPGHEPHRMEQQHRRHHHRHERRRPTQAQDGAGILRDHAPANGRDQHHAGKGRESGKGPRHPRRALVQEHPQKDRDQHHLGRRGAQRRSGHLHGPPDQGLDQEGRDHRRQYGRARRQEDRQGDVGPCDQRYQIGRRPAGAAPHQRQAQEQSRSGGRRCRLQARPQQQRSAHDEGGQGHDQELAQHPGRDAGGVLPEDVGEVLLLERHAGAHHDGGQHGGDEGALVDPQQGGRGADGQKRGAEHEEGEGRRQLGQGGVQPVVVVGGGGEWLRFFLVGNITCGGGMPPRDRGDAPRADRLDM
mmetsp:Transcript_27179/g.78404  ORF Transcript_27179/g.78404 Transcript_27179/m.78404 type:complete len:354 (+) Transcript_27179:1-1062(+)